MKRILCLLVFLSHAPLVGAQDLPKQYDLRKVNGITPIKSQQGGTCWAHGTMAAIESNLIVSGTWKKLGNTDQPLLSEYHLDWWNGFNQHTNDDIPDVAKNPSGLTPHQGGDYRVSTAYMSRGDGVVTVPMKDGKPDTTTWYKDIPQRLHPEYKRFYARDVEWFTIGDNLENINAIKQRIMKEGAMGTAYAVNGGLISKDFVHYQPKEHGSKPNHAVAIVGWDDDKVSADPDKKTPKPGAWLIKNSWGTSRNVLVNDKDGKAQTVKKSMGEDGFYWISYYDKVCCRDPEMGAVSFRNVEPLRYHHIYFHDLHGWRGTISDINKACNVFKATGKQDIQSLSFYTAADNVKYTASVYTKFEKGQLTGLRASRTGTIERTGFHTIDLEKAVRIEKDEQFIVCLEVSHGGMAIDRTSEIEVLLQPDPKKEQPDPKKEQPKFQPKKGIQKGPRGPNNGPVVFSKANPEESFYYNGKIWRDLYEYRFDNPNWAMFDRTANFCMKACAVNVN